MLIARRHAEILVSECRGHLTLLAEPMVAATEILLQERVSPMFVIADG